MADFIVSYDGLTASQHRMDMRRFGYAMVGLDHVITGGLIALSEHRVAKPRERVPFDLVASDPKRGSVELFGALMAGYQGSQGNLPFLVQLLNDAFPDLLWHWLSWVFKSLGGREKEAEPHFEKLLEFMGKVHSQEKTDRERERRFLIQVLDRIIPNAGSRCAGWRVQRRSEVQKPLWRKNYGNRRGRSSRDPLERTSGGRRSPQYAD